MAKLVGLLMLPRMIATLSRVSQSLRATDGLLRLARVVTVTDCYLLP
jgi:hypothetical protein